MTFLSAISFADDNSSLTVLPNKVLVANLRAIGLPVPPGQPDYVQVLILSTAPADGFKVSFIGVHDGVEYTQSGLTRADNYSGGNLWSGLAWFNLKSADDSYRVTVEPVVGTGKTAMASGQ